MITLLRSQVSFGAVCSAEFPEQTKREVYIKQVLWAHVAVNRTNQVPNFLKMNFIAIITLPLLLTVYQNISSNILTSVDAELFIISNW